MFLSTNETIPVGIGHTVCSLVLSILDLPPLLAGLIPSVGEPVTILICFNLVPRELAYSMLHCFGVTKLPLPYVGGFE